MNKNISFKTRLLGMQASMLNFAYKLTADKDNAYDLVQDTTLKALCNEDKFVNNNNLKGWLFIIMKNIFINNFRKSVKEGVITDLSDELYMKNMLSHADRETPEGIYSVKEISDAINSLQDELKNTFSMYVAGYKYEEIATQMNVPIGTVKSRIFVARKELKQMLKHYRTSL